VRDERITPLCKIFYAELAFAEALPIAESARAGLRA
jgi:hypothetical protein